MAVNRFRKKPVEIEAVQVTQENWQKVCDFVLQYGATPKDLGQPVAVAGPPHLGLIIHTLEGDMRASIGDWIIKGVQGEYYPCKPDIFEATYEAI